MFARLSPRRLLALGAMVAVAAVAGLYLLFFTPDSPDEFRLEAQSGETTAAGEVDTSALAGTWRPTSDSQVGYRVREKLARLPASSDAVGRTDAVTGAVVLEADGDAYRATDATFEVDLTKVRSDESKRDERMRTMGFESDRFPTAGFRATAPIDVPTAALSGQIAQVQAKGDLTIHGTTKAVTIPLDVQLVGGEIKIVGRLTFPFADFGMTPPNVAGGIVTVESEPTLELSLVLTRGA